MHPLAARDRDAPIQLTASQEGVSDPQWSPDGRRLAYVRDGEIWIVDADGSRETLVVAKPGGGREPRWSPDGRRLAFLSRRRGWSQVWLIDAPVPRRGRPQRDPRAPIATALTPAGIDVNGFAWSPDGTTIAIAAQLRPDDLSTTQIALVDVASGAQQVVAGEASHDAGPRWAADGALVYVSDASGWFQVVRRSPDGRDRIVLTDGDREHGEPSGGIGYAAMPSPDASRLLHIEVHDGLVDLVVPLPERRPAAQARSRPPAQDATHGARRGRQRGHRLALAGCLARGRLVAGRCLGGRGGRERDPTAGPVAAAGARCRARRRPAPPGHRFAPGRSPAALAPGRVAAGERVVFTARDGLRVEGTLWRPSGATGKRGGKRVPTIVYPHGGPTWQAYRSFAPFRLLLAKAGYAFLDVDFRGSTGYGRAFRQANHDEWGHADVHDMVDAGRWVQDQPWSDGRLAIYGGSYGGYLVLCALVEEPTMWSAGIDLYGDSEISESFHHGDRPGRLDLQKMMGTPDDPARTASFRRGSPVYRAERIEAPLLILHGRKDKRVVPLMTERMVEALEIEDKTHEVHWYDDEGHGWEKRENRRDAFERTLAFLRTHVPIEG